MKNTGGFRHRDCISGRVFCFSGRVERLIFTPPRQAVCKQGAEGFRIGVWLVRVVRTSTSRLAYPPSESTLVSGRLDAEGVIPGRCRRGRSPERT